MNSSEQRPFTASHSLLRAEPDQVRPRARLPAGAEDRTICRWCLQKFDESECAPHSIAERGYMRTRLGIADSGQELICCDNCWPGACGYPSPAATQGFGQIIPPPDANAIPNLLLRALAKTE